MILPGGPPSGGRTMVDGVVADAVAAADNAFGLFHAELFGGGAPNMLPPARHHTITRR